MADVNGIPVVEFTAAENIFMATNFHNHWEEVIVSEGDYSLTLQQVLDYIGDGTFSVNGDYFYVPIWEFTKLTNDAESGNFVNKDTLIPCRYGGTAYTLFNGTFNIPIPTVNKYIPNMLAIPIPFTAIEKLRASASAGSTINVTSNMYKAYINPSAENAEIPIADNMFFQITK